MADETLISIRDIVRCPNCASEQIVYTCEPKCCFNHLCAGCQTTFQLITQKLGGSPLPPRSDVTPPESSDPTAACAACESLRVYGVSVSGSKVACADCGALLGLAYEDIAPA